MRSVVSIFVVRSMRYPLLMLSGNGGRQTDMQHVRCWGQDEAEWKKDADSLKQFY